MDRALDDVIGERQGGNRRGGRNGRRNNWPRDGARKTNGREDNYIDTDWLHDKFEDDADARRSTQAPRNQRMNIDRYSPEPDPSQGARLRVDNLHYDLTEDDLDDLFNRIAPVTSLSLKFDRAGRSTGTAYVTYSTVSSARAAIRDFDGANANGQPIRLSLLPSGPSSSSTNGRNVPLRNPFDSAVKPGRSLFDRIEEPRGVGRNDRSRIRDRSRSPDAPRRTDTRKPPPENIDRYVPGDKGRRGSRSRSPMRNPRRRRDDGGGRGRGGGRDGGRGMVNGRPRVTQEELDKEMEDYWGKKGQTNGAAGANGNTATASAPVPTIDDGDIDMIE